MQACHALFGSTVRQLQPSHHEITPSPTWVIMIQYFKLSMKEALPFKKQTKQTRNAGCLNTIPQPKPQNSL